MTTDRLMALDLLVSVLAAAAWVSAGAAAAARRPRTAAALLAGALAATLTRAWTVLALAGAGWWFVQEKVTVALPLLVAGGAVATAVAGPRLLAAVRRPDPPRPASATRPVSDGAGSDDTDGAAKGIAEGIADDGRGGGRNGGEPGVRPSDAVRSPAVVVPLLGAGYAALAGPVQTFLIGYPADLSTGLLLVAAVAGAVLVTWRAMTARVPGLRAATVATVVAGLLGAGLAFVPAAAEEYGAPTAHEHTGTAEPSSNESTGTAQPATAHQHAAVAEAATVHEQAGAGQAATAHEHAAAEHVGTSAAARTGSASTAADARAESDHTTASPTAAPTVSPTDTSPALSTPTSTGMSPGSPAARSVTALRGPAAPAPGGTVRRFTLTARTATVTLSSGRRVAAWTFDGRVPGPPITATQGDLVEVRLRNADIASGVTLHWHGYDVPSGEDGVPGLTQEAVPPAGEFVYRFVAAQAGTYWYHTHEVSDLGVRMGLYGTLVVAPRSGSTEGVDLTLPVHTFGGTTVVGDHDQPMVREAAPGTSVRLRLINTDNTPHRFTLAGTPYRLVAVDGTDLSGPGVLSRVALRLAAGGRYDLAFTMPSGPVVLWTDDRTESVRLTPPAAATGTGAGSTTGATAGWPELDLTRYGTPAPTPYARNGPFDREYTLVLDRGLALVDGKPMYAHTVNGRAFPNVPTQMVTEGDLVRLTVVNRGRDTHPWHLHGHHVLVLSRDGRAPTGSPLWLDTFDVRPGEVWEVAFRAGNPGLWMNHCHNLSHADMGMMLHLAYEGVTTPFHGGHGG